MEALSLVDRFIRLLLKLRRRGIVLFGHGVTSKETDPTIECLHFGTEATEAVIKYFQALGFDFISMADLLSLSKTGFRFNRSWIHLTFDDGYRNNCTELHPILARLRIPWTVFVTTRNIETGERFFTYRIRCAFKHGSTESLTALTGNGDGSKKAASEFSRSMKRMGISDAKECIRRVDLVLGAEQWRDLAERYPSDEVMTIEDLRMLADDPMVYIGSHSSEHFVLNSRLQACEVKEQLEDSMEWISSKTGVRPLAFCYPNGKSEDRTEISRKLCMEAGYRLAFTTEFGAVSEVTDAYCIPRPGFPQTIVEARKLVLKLLVKWRKGK